MNRIAVLGEEPAKESWPKLRALPSQGGDGRSGHNKETKELFPNSRKRAYDPLPDLFVAFLETLFGMCPDSPRCTFHCPLCSADWSLVHFSSTQATKIVIADIKCILASRAHPTGARVSRSFPSTVSPGFLFEFGDSVQGIGESIPVA
jgi:hypothetical protein